MVMQLNFEITQYKVERGAWIQCLFISGKYKLENHIYEPRKK